MYSHPFIYRDGSRQGIIEINLISYAKEPSKGCLMAVVEDQNLINKIKSFQQSSISNDNLAPDGLEDEPHVTILYGFDSSFNSDNLNKILKHQNPIKFQLGQISRFETPDYDVLKLETKCEAAQQLHYSLKNEFYDSIASKYPVYHPHMTLGYVKKGAHSELDGNQSLAGEKFEIAALVYALADDRKIFRLKG